MSQKEDKGKCLFFRESTFKIAEAIFNNPNKTYHIRMLEKETGLSTTAITNSIKELKEFNIVKIEETPITKNIKADLESASYQFYKQVFNLYILKKYVFIDNLITLFHNPEAIVLFGSFAKGEDIEESDIDILIISTKKDIDTGKFIKKYENTLKRKINLHVLPSLEKSVDEFKNAIANGIVLHGYIKVI